MEPGRCACGGGAGGPLGERGDDVEEGEARDVEGGRWGAEVCEVQVVGYSCAAVVADEDDREGGGCFWRVRRMGEFV